MKRQTILIGIGILLSGSLTLAAVESVPAGVKVAMEGVLVQKTDSGFLLRTHSGSRFSVVVTPNTRIVEKKLNPFRSATDYNSSALLPGLNVRVEGFGDMEGALLAEKVRFTKDELKVARTISSSVYPVEERLSQTQTELEQARSEMRQSSENLNMKTDSLQGQVEELDGAFQLARSEARQAQGTADEALRRVSGAEDRLENLDQYREREMVTILFRFNSAELTQEGKQRLDELADRLAAEEGYLLEIAGFTSSDGNPEYNRRLSERRIEEVISYLVENHSFPLRRMIRPHGFGESRPVGDNSTRDGREQNRRVELRVLQNVGLTSTDASSLSRSGSVQSLSLSP